MKTTGFLALGTAITIALAAVPAFAAGDAANGAKVYAKNCKACHSTQTGKHKMGPSLAGMVGKKAGATNFKKYKGLKGSKIVWDAANLDKFLANPRKFLGKKTNMFKKLKNADQRADVIAYMKTLKQ
jgi:cytochrome c